MTKPVATATSTMSHSYHSRRGDYLAVVFKAYWGILGCRIAVLWHKGFSRTKNLTDDEKKMKKMEVLVL